MERLRETVTILMDHVSTIAPQGVFGGIVLIFGFVILALGIDRIRAKIDGLTNDVDELSRRVDSLTLAVTSISDTRSERKKPATEAGDAEANLEEIRKRLEALSARSERNTEAAN